MTVRRILTIGGLVLAILAAAVLLFFAGDHDDTYPRVAPSSDRSAPAENNLSR
jgi:hypothetical protein